MIRHRRGSGARPEHRHVVQHPSGRELELHTAVAREFPLADARAVYEEFASGSRRGRIVLTF
ncbi:MAG TPA: hypothetical protein VGD00_10695 [Solirubrobacteraceae bacterium]